MFQNIFWHVLNIENFIAVINIVSFPVLNKRCFIFALTNSINDTDIHLNNLSENAINTVLAEKYFKHIKHTKKKSILSRNFITTESGNEE